ncbi:MAG TPA: hypothetical protein VFJ30_02195 [Phycisphaerae bacterium]|nr:hypothetical protein [Phycisphaerae bacterium]
MFQTIASDGGPLVPGPSVGPLHGSYPYLRLFFGRFLADVSVEPDGRGHKVGWLIPGGEEAPPAPQRLRRELEALGQAMTRAYEEVHGKGHGRSRGAEVVRRTVAAQVLGEWRVPMSAEDVRFNPSGELVVINWCTERPGNSRRLADWEPRQVIQRLAGSFKVPAPDIKPLPKPRISSSVPAPGTPGPRAETPRALAPPQPAGSGLGQKTWHWMVLGLALLGVLVAGLAIGHNAGFTKGKAFADGRPSDGRGSIQTTSGQDLDLASSVMPSGAQAMVFHNMAAESGGYDRVTVWVPLRPEGSLGRGARRFGGLVGGDGRTVSGRLWLVYGQDYPHDAGRIGPVSYRLGETDASAEPVQLGLALRAPTRRYDGAALRSSPAVGASAGILHWRVW